VAAGTTVNQDTGITRFINRQTGGNQQMKIEILGTGCAKCKTLYENVKKAVEESGKSAEVVKVEDIPTIMKFGVMSTPALVIDGQVKFSGKLASVAEIKGML
jgi:small redox-active disulfide protein 2